MVTSPWGIIWSVIVETRGIFEDVSWVAVDHWSRDHQYHWATTAWYYNCISSPLLLTLGYAQEMGAKKPWWLASLTEACHKITSTVWRMKSRVGVLFVYFGSGKYDNEDRIGMLAETWYMIWKEDHSIQHHNCTGTSLLHLLWVEDNQKYCYYLTRLGSESSSSWAACYMLVEVPEDSILILLL